jgi:hypothetical protein
MNEWIDNRLPSIGNCEHRRAGVVRTLKNNEMQANRKVTVSKPDGLWETNAR